MLGCDEKSLMWWEQDAREPLPRFYPAVIQFLGREPWVEPPSLPERLQGERLRRGLTIEEAAEVVGVDEGTYGRWERGERKPQPHSLTLVAAFLDALPV